MAMFHSSVVTLAKNKKKHNFLQVNMNELKNFNVSDHLQKQFEGNNWKDWQKLRSSMIGLPVNEHSLVSKVNLDTILWEEIVQFGSIEIALDYVDNVDISREKSLGGLIKLLRRVVIEHLIIITPFI